MRLNAVWGLEPNANAIDIEKATVDNEAALDGGVFYNCVDEERRLDINEMGLTELDKMIYCFK